MAQSKRDYRNTADLESNANLTNLAVKGILGIEAMHQISQALGKTADAGNFAVSPNVFVCSVTSHTHTLSHRPLLHRLQAHGRRLPLRLTAAICWLHMTTGSLGHCHTTCMLIR